MASSFGRSRSWGSSAINRINRLFISNLLSWKQIEKQEKEQKWQRNKRLHSHTSWHSLSCSETCRFVGASDYSKLPSHCLNLSLASVILGSILQRVNKWLMAIKMEVFLGGMSRYYLIHSLHRSSTLKSLLEEVCLAHTHSCFRCSLQLSIDF